MNTQIKNIIDSFETEFGLDEIAEASDYAQDEVSNFLENQGEGVEITIEDGDVIVDATQEIIDLANDYAGFCNDLQDRFNDSFKFYLTGIETRK